jgi:hypothetical protein
MTSIGDEAFRDCSGLTRLTIPANMTRIGDSDRTALQGVTSLERVTLVSSPLDAEVVEIVEPALASGARVISAALAGQMFGRFMIVAA